MRRGEARVIEFRSTKSAAVQFFAALATCALAMQQKDAVFEQVLGGALRGGSVLPEMQYA